MATTTTTTAADTTVRGRVIKVENSKVVFAPTGTNYELLLETAQPYTGPLNELLNATVRVKARKVYTVPSGGGFITPLFGPPRIVQGRALALKDGWLLIRAGLPVMVELPKEDNALDFEEGPIAVGSIVNAVCLPGARIELANVKIVKR